MTLNVIVGDVTTSSTCSHVTFCGWVILALLFLLGINLASSKE